jgi:COX assembly protein 1
MDTLSRREEDALMKSTKAKALKECDPLVKSANHKTTVFSLCTENF